MEGLIIRPVEEHDAAAIRRIADQTPEAARWDSPHAPEMPGWAAEGAGRILGFLIARVAADEMEILNLAVEPGARRHGVGSRLLMAAIEYGRRSGAERGFLEVRESNDGAKRFYERHGFVVIGCRPHYYREPAEDALLMSRSLNDEQ